MDLDALCYSLAKHIVKENKRKDGQKGLLPEDHLMFERSRTRWVEHEKQMAEVRRKIRKYGPLPTIYSDPSWKPSTVPVKYRYDEQGNLVRDDGLPLPSKSATTEDTSKLSEVFGGLFDGIT